MRKTLIYDLPTRLFHWLFAGFFLTSFVIAKTVDDESILFSYHMISGLLLGGLVAWRLVWGVIGSQHARFADFSLNPMDLKDYFLGFISGSKKKWSGHNPASSWAAIVMLILAAGLAVTGYLMSTGGKETFEDIHELIANAFIVVVGLHVTGIVLHTIRHKDIIGLSMLDGKKDLPDSKDAITSMRPLAAGILVLLVGASAFYLNKNFDTSKGTLNLFGKTLEIGEGQEQGYGNSHEEENE